MSDAKNVMTVADLVEMRDGLFEKMGEMYDQIEEMSKGGVDTRGHEMVWARMLAQYEHLCFRIAERFTGMEVVA